MKVEEKYLFLINDIAQDKIRNEMILSILEELY